jgi:adenine-specific DNA-methyltransferase
MPNREQLRDRLIKKLEELFQLNQPDLDFGFYRIMHAKAKQVEDFIENDLLKTVEVTIGAIDDDKKASAKADYEAAIETAKKFGAPDPESAQGVKEAKARYESVLQNVTSEAEIYDHLYRFFERYYDTGDFLSRRYFTRETESKAAPFAIPYNGEEVKLHWANADQYYIKTDEHFTNFSFDLRQAKELVEMGGELFSKTDNEDAASPLRVHLRIIDASEGEHGNIKATNDEKRFFIIHMALPVELNDVNELVINFEYRADPDKTGQDATWRKKKNEEAVETILKDLEEKAAKNDRIKEYYHLLKLPSPTESDKDRSLIARYLNKYTARNTMDYFIHKDLGSFLKRELDFYIKNEVMRLDDIQNADVPAVESYLEKIKALRIIALKLIEFLAQLENFQKKLWLKKKFVVEANYCITLDRVPEEFYQEIAANEAQHDEWVALFAINEIEEGVGVPGYSKPLSIEFLRANDKLVLDTRFFDESFKAKLLAAIEDFDEQCDGLLVHSENFQALNLLEIMYKKTIRCVYIDPPYNAKSSEIVYKNSYKHSSWLSLMHNRIEESMVLLTTNATFACAIDEIEQEKLGMIFDLFFKEGYEKTCVTVVHNPSGQQGDNFSYTHEFVYMLYKVPGRSIAEQYREDESDWDIRNFRDVTGDESLRKAGPNCFYPIYVSENKVVGFGDVCEENYHPNINETLEDGTVAVYPIDPKGIERKWRFAIDTVGAIKDQLIVNFIKQRKVYDIKRLKKTFNYKTTWVDPKYSANNYGTQLLNHIIPNAPFSYPKSIYTVKDSIFAGLNNEKEAIILDYFAGSGTTAHAVINLNREDDGQRKYIMVEMGHYFDTVMKLRIAKVIYSDTWKNGKPTARHTGISHCFKYIRLESYEDTLNNLRFDDNLTRNETLTSNKTLREDYMLHYLLDIETKGSQSLLNIENFQDPTNYIMKIKKPGSDEYVKRNVDLIETFNYLIGLRVNHIAEAQQFNAEFKREVDPDLPDDINTKLIIDGGIKKVADGSWWFRKIEGWLPADINNPNNGKKEKVLIVWRKLTGNIEEDNLVLDEWFAKNRISTRDFEFDLIYVNGSNNLPNLAQAEDTWKVRLIEEEFMKRMWEGC